jgi:hypothetical protein
MNQLSLRLLSAIETPLIDTGFRRTKGNFTRSSGGVLQVIEYIFRSPTGVDSADFTVRLGIFAEVHSQFFQLKSIRPERAPWHTDLPLLLPADTPAWWNADAATLDATAATQRELLTTVVIPLFSRLATPKELADSLARGPAIPVAPFTRKLNAAVIYFQSGFADLALGLVHELTINTARPADRQLLQAVASRLSGQPARLAKLRSIAAIDLIGRWRPAHDDLDALQRFGDTLIEFRSDGTLIFKETRGTGEWQWTYQLDGNTLVTVPLTEEPMTTTHVDLTEDGQLLLTNSGSTSRFRRVD